MRFLQRDFALKTIWIDDNYFNARSMDVYITKLRKHLKEDESIEIINIHGKGYKLITPEADVLNRTWFSDGTDNKKRRLHCNRLFLFLFLGINPQFFC